MRLYAPGWTLLRKLDYQHVDPWRSTFGAQDVEGVGEAGWVGAGEDERTGIHGVSETCVTYRNGPPQPGPFSLIANDLLMAAARPARALAAQTIDG